MHAPAPAARFAPSRSTRAPGLAGDSPTVVANPTSFASAASVTLSAPNSACLAIDSAFG